MKALTKISAYSGVLVVGFAGAFGVGSLTGSPVDQGDETDGEPHGETHAEPAAGHSASAAGLPAGLQVSESAYTLSPISAPASAGKPGTLSFSILGPNGAPVTEFTEAHEKDLHLIVVRSDTTGYRHVHPVLGQDGIWSIDWSWDTGGTYKVFADFEPTTLGEGLTLARTVDVAGTVTPAPAQAESAVAEVDDYTVSIEGDLVTGKGSDVTVTVERAGRPVTDLEPYLGAYGHLVALRDGDLAYLHVHPEGEPGDGVTEPGPDVSFAVQTPTAGRYRLFFDFQIGGEVRTAEFTLTAAGSASTAAADPSGDGHGGHDE